jgi:hypothetical protein
MKLRCIGWLADDIMMIGWLADDIMMQSAGGRGGEAHQGWTAQ